MRGLVVALAFIAPVASGCATTRGAPYPDDSGDVVVVEGGVYDVYEGRGPRALAEVPEGHYPPPGECRVWYLGVEPGQQPPPVKCDSLTGGVPYGAFLLYNEKPWDSEYDWREHARRNPGSVPEMVLRLLGS